MGTLSATVHLYKHDAESAKGYTLPNIMFAAGMPQFLFRRKNTILSVTYQAKKHKKKIIWRRNAFFISLPPNNSYDMKTSIVARETEIRQLDSLMEEELPQFVAVYGRFPACRRRRFG